MSNKTEVNTEQAHIQYTSTLSVVSQHNVIVGWCL